MTTLAPDIDIQKLEIQQIFKTQQAYQQTMTNTTARERIAKLNKLLKVLNSYRQEIRDALFKDFKKHASEVDLTELYPIITEIKHAKSHLRSWMRPKRVSTPLSLLGTSSYVQHDPKGVVLIIAPWNYPVNLVFCPLVSAIAAGNCVIVKPSEHTPHTSGVMKKIISAVFEEREVALVEGGVETSTSLLELPFNHIFFTGAPSIGKVVMRAAANHLTSVTLELGGKSPTIIDESADIAKAAKRIAWAKFHNNGQICIAPDYLFIHESKQAEFIEKFKAVIQHFFDNPLHSESYCRIVNQRHHQRIKSYVDDALSKGAKIEIGGTFDEKQNFIAPTLMTEVSLDSKLMTEEIFGPILPLFTFKKIEEVSDFINKGEKPLALYIYSKKRKNVNFILKNTKSGGVSINHSILHFLNMNLPFGGANNSGIGKSHGYYGFEAFSEAKGILKQWAPWSILELVMPPYSGIKQKLIDITLRWF